MPIDAATISASATYKLLKTVTGLDSVVSGPQTKSKTLLSSTVYDQVFYAQYTIAAAGTQVVDLSSFTNELGEAVTGSKAVGILLIPTGTNAKAKLEADASNGLAWFFKGTTPGVEIPSGGFLAYAEPVGQTIDGTHKRLLITNTGSGSLTLDILIYVLD